MNLIVRQEILARMIRNCFLIQGEAPPSYTLTYDNKQSQSLSLSYKTHIQTSWSKWFWTGNKFYEWKRQTRGIDARLLFCFGIFVLRCSTTTEFVVQKLMIDTNVITAWIVTYAHNPKAQSIRCTVKKVPHEKREEVEFYGYKTIPSLEP